MDDLEEDGEVYDDYDCVDCDVWYYIEVTISTIFATSFLLVYPSTCQQIMYMPQVVDEKAVLPAGIQLCHQSIRQHHVNVCHRGSMKMLHYLLACNCAINRYASIMSMYATGGPWKCCTTCWHATVPSIDTTVFHQSMTLTAVCHSVPCKQYV